MEPYDANEAGNTKRGSKLSLTRKRRADHSSDLSPTLTPHGSQAFDASDSSARSIKGPHTSELDNAAVILDNHGVGRADIRFGDGNSTTHHASDSHIVSLDICQDLRHVHEEINGLVNGRGRDINQQHEEIYFTQSDLEAYPSVSLLYDVFERHRTKKVAQTRYEAKDDLPSMRRDLEWMQRSRSSAARKNGFILHDTLFSGLVMDNQDAASPKSIPRKQSIDEADPTSLYFR
eukprot:TRINITY_DN10562_c0_g1_i1.p1 TRINITY_DN10562_c0_g1~~TRINITY_DN10562_c0_g1_i1.p1  ORF type:complete len:233 (+),score=44.93 TRINITY_DN10562_c0_g1_i1:51-749(+)